MSRILFDATPGVQAAYHEPAPLETHYDGFALQLEPFEMPPREMYLDSFVDFPVPEESGRTTFDATLSYVLHFRRA